MAGTTLQWWFCFPGALGRYDAEHPGNRTLKVIVGGKCWMSFRMVLWIAYYNEAHSSVSTGSIIFPKAYLAEPPPWRVMQAAFESPCTVLQFLIWIAQPTSYRKEHCCPQKLSAQWHSLQTLQTPMSGPTTHQACCYGKLLKTPYPHSLWKYATSWHMAVGGMEVWYVGVCYSVPKLLLSFGPSGMEINRHSRQPR